MALAPDVNTQHVVKRHRLSGLSCLRINFCLIKKEEITREENLFFMIEKLLWDTLYALRLNLLGSGLYYRSLRLVAIIRSSMVHTTDH